MTMIDFSNMSCQLVSRWKCFFWRNSKEEKTFIHDSYWRMLAVCNMTTDSTKGMEPASSMCWRETLSDNSGMNTRQIPRFSGFTRAILESF